jgi:hypothetical protein
MSIKNFLISFLVVITLTTHSYDFKNRSTHSSKVPDWAKKGSFIKGMYFYSLGVVEGNNLAKCKKIAADIAKKRIIAWIWLAATKKKSLDVIVKYHDSEITSLNIVEDKIMKKLLPKLGKTPIYSIYYNYDDENELYTLWLMVKAHGAVVSSIKGKLDKLVKEQERIQTVIICTFKNVDKLGQNKYVPVKEIETALTKEFKRHDYHIVSNSIPFRAFSPELSINELATSFNDIFKNTKIKRVIWCVLSKKNIVVSPSKRKKGYKKGFVSLTIRLINIKNGSVRNTIFKEEVVVHDSKSTTTIKSAYNLLLKNLRISEEDLR